MAQTILYFTAGEKPTVDEAADIAALETLVAPAYEFKVSRGDASTGDQSYGYGVQEPDFVAGEVPDTIYDGIPVLDLDDDIPLTALPGGTVAVLNSAGADSHNGTAEGTGGDLTGVKLASTVAMVDNADTVAVRNSAGADSHNATAVVAAGVITGVNLAATVGMADNGDTVSATGAGTVATLVVANGVITGVTLA